MFPNPTIVYVRRASAVFAFQAVIVVQLTAIYAFPHIYHLFLVYVVSNLLMHN